MASLTANQYFHADGTMILLSFISVSLNSYSYAKSFERAPFITGSVVGGTNLFWGMYCLLFDYMDYRVNKTASLTRARAELLLGGALSFAETAAVIYAALQLCFDGKKAATLHQPIKCLGFTIATLFLDSLLTIWDWWTVKLRRMPLVQRAKLSQRQAGWPAATSEATPTPTPTTTLWPPSVPQELSEPSIQLQDPPLAHFPPV
jgi:hypothetical protein